MSMTRFHGFKCDGCGTERHQPEEDGVPMYWATIWVRRPYPGRKDYHLCQDCLSDGGQAVLFVTEEARNPSAE